MSAIVYFWIAFAVLFSLVFYIDMYVTGRRSHTISTATSLRWSLLWVVLALSFGIAIYFFYPQHTGSTSTSLVMMVKFISGYLTEYSLSIDNLFVFIMIFSLMAVHEKNQPKLLKLGILLSIILRVVFIMGGMKLVQHFEWVFYLFGVILIVTAYKLATSKSGEHVNPKRNLLYRLVSRLLPVDPDPHSSRFIHRINGRWHITSIFLVLVVIGSTDVLFAVDSIPAIIGVINEGASGILSPSEEDFIAITSNVFAVMGLVSLFFALKGIIGMLRFLKHGVSAILFFIGAKMLVTAIPSVEHFFATHSWASLVIIVAILSVAVMMSLLMPSKKKPENKPIFVINPEVQEELEPVN